MDLFEKLIYLIFELIGNEGWTIVLLSLLVNIFLLPFYWLSDLLNEIESNRLLKMKPELDKIKNLKNNKEKYFYKKEIYKRNKYKYYYSLTSILGLLVQIPFFLAAYYVLIENQLFDDKSFYFIKNLNLPDGLILIGQNSINFLPILMTIISVVSTYYHIKTIKSPKNIQLYLLPFFFLIFLYRFPSSIVLYWTINNLFSIFKNYIFSKFNSEKLKVIVLKCYRNSRLFLDTKNTYFLLILPFVILKLFSVSSFLNLFPLIISLFLIETILNKITIHFKFLFVPLLLCFFYVINFNDLFVMIFNSLIIWKSFYSILFLIILGTSICYLNKKTVRSFVFLFSFFIIIFNIFTEIQKPKNLDDKPNIVSKKTNRTTILIVMDEYASPNELTKHFGIESNIFKDFLTNSGWKVKSDFFTEELSTANSLTSMFNYNLTNSKEFQSGKKNFRYINSIDLQNSKLILDLKKHNLSVKSFGYAGFNNDFNYDFVPLRDYDKINAFFNLSRFNKFLTFLEKNTFFHDVFDKSILSIIDRKYRVEKFKLSVFEEFNINNISKFDFIYYHFFMPHHPYEFMGNSFSFDLNGYFKYYQYVSLDILLDKIKCFPKENLKIIITGDHGYRQNPKVNPYNTFSAFYGFENNEVDKIKKVQDIGLFIKNQILKNN